jgi:hypothetical protein
MHVVNPCHALAADVGTALGASVAVALQRNQP